MDKTLTVALLWVSSSLGPSMALTVNIFHQCLVRSQTSIGPGRFLAFYFILFFTFLSWYPVVNQLRTSGRNSWLWREKRKFSELSFVTLCWELYKMWSVLHANEWWETSNAAGNSGRQWTTADIVQCHPPWPGSCQSCVLKKRLRTPTSERQRLSEGETA